MTGSLILDTSPWASHAPSAYARLFTPWQAVILKGGEGLSTTETWRGKPWLRAHAEGVRAAGLDLGLYWYLRLDRDGAAQADAFADLLARVPTTLRAIVDVEEGNNEDAVAQYGAGIVTVTLEAFVQRIAQRTGMPPILYAGGWARSLRLGRCGCAALWLSAVVAKLPAEQWCAQLGFPLADLWAWQYAVADGRGMASCLEGWPRETPIGDADISAVVMPDGIARMRWAERPC